MGKTKSLIRVEVTEIVVTPQKISVKNVLAEFVVEYTELTSLGCKTESSTLGFHRPRVHFF
jgi:hypothetical protein